MRGGHTGKAMSLVYRVDMLFVVDVTVYLVRVWESKMAWHPPRSQLRGREDVFMGLT